MAHAHGGKLKIEGFELFENFSTDVFEVNVQIFNASISRGLFNIVVHTEMHPGNSGDSWLSDL